MRRIKNEVEALLREKPELRDSDRALLLAYWASEGLVLDEEQRRVFMTTTIAESITRARRGLRAKYPGKSEVEQERYNKYTNYRRGEHWWQD